MSDIDVNKIQQNVKELQDQNFINFQQWKKLGKDIEKLSEKIKLSDTNLIMLMKKIKNDYEKLKKIIIDENVQVQLNNKIEDNKTEIKNNKNKTDYNTNKIQENKNEINKKVNIETFEKKVSEINSELGKKVNKKEMRYLNVKDYGAIGDGIVDDTESIINTINKAVETNLLRIYMPPGTYKTTQTIYMPSGFEILGGTHKKNNVLIDYNGNSWAIATSGKVGEHRRNKISSINIKLNSSSLGAILLGVIGDSNGIIPVHHTLEDIEIHNITGNQIGIMQKNVSGVLMQNVKSNWGTGGTGLVIVADGNNSGVCTYNNCVFGRINQNNVGVELKGGSGGLDGYCFNACYFGGKTPFKLSGRPIKNICINGAHIEATPNDNENYYGFDISEVTGLNINAITFASFSNPNFKAFVFRGFCSSVNITGVDCNEFNGGTLYYNRHTSSPRNSILEFGGLSGTNRIITQTEGIFTEALLIETSSISIKNIKTSQMIMNYGDSTCGLRYSSTKPTNISRGDFVFNSLPVEKGSEGSKYIIIGWSGLSTNNAIECRVQTGN